MIRAENKLQSVYAEINREQKAIVRLEKRTLLSRNPRLCQQRIIEHMRSLESLYSRALSLKNELETVN